MMEEEEIRCHTEWIHLAEERVPWWILVNTAVNLWVAQKDILLAKLKATSCVMALPQGICSRSVQVQFVVHKLAMGHVAL
jgi:hypothetical protein